MRRFILAAGLSGVILGLGVAACGGSAATPEAGSEAQAAPVRVAVAASAPFLSEIRTVGRVEPDKAYVLAFKTAGVIAAIHVEEGDAVTKGQVLAELDPRDVEAQFRQAQEAADKAARDLARVRKLHAGGFASDAALQDAEAQAKSTKATAQAARSNKGYAAIVAPADGVVLRRAVEANGVVAAGAPVLTLSDMSESFMLAAGLADRDALRVAVGDAATVTLDAFPGQVFAATLSEIGADADPRTGTFQIKLRIAASDAPLKSGLVGRAAIRPATQANAGLAIPIDAILEGHGATAMVFVVDADGAAKRTRITTGRISGGLVAVTAGLNPGDQVVVDGAGYLTDGEKVAIATASAE